MNKIALAALAVVALVFYLLGGWISRGLLTGAVALGFLWLAPDSNSIKKAVIGRRDAQRSQHAHNGSMENGKEGDSANGRLPSAKYMTSDKYHPNKLPEDIDVIVIGSGMSGLTTAAVLSRLGRRVLVLEKHPTTAGGGTHMYSFSGFRFDAGLHYTVPWSSPLFWLTCGSSEASPKLIKLGHGETDGTFDKIVLGHDAPFHMKDKERHIKDMYAMFPDPKDRAAIDAYIKLTNKVLPTIFSFAISKLLPLSWQPWYWRIFMRTWCKYASQTADQLLGQITDNKKLISLLCGMWIDTGARPDTATFFLTASVFRGLAIEGAVYPEGGSDMMARALIPIILNGGGRVLINAPVQEILVEKAKGSAGPNGATYRATGVRMANGKTIYAKEAVVSSAGYHNTFGHLVQEWVTSELNIPRKLSVPESDGFVMCNVGIRGNSEELGIPNCNMWVHPVDEKGDLFPPLQQYYEDPLNSEISAMITFPSLKDRAWEGKFPNKMCCQILVIAKFDWFRKWAAEPSGTRSEAYQQLKKRWEAKCLDLLYRHFPQVKGRVEFVDLSTPLSIKEYISSQSGGAVGLDQTPERYTSWEVQKRLDVSTPIAGLYMTGQDIFVCGVTLAQVAGLITGMRMVGFTQSVKLVLQSLLFG